MDSIFEKITKAINDFLMSVIESSLSTMFNDVNEKVGTIAAEFGKCNTPDCGAYHHIYSLL